MKINFWQILGIILLIGGAIWFVYNKNHGIPNSTHDHPTTTTVR
jgi:TM2 domain-containing membrane protein YozV